MLRFSLHISMSSYREMETEVLGFKGKATIGILQIAV